MSPAVRLVAVALAVALLAGCGSEPAPTGEGAAPEATIAAIKAANDANLDELSLQIGWFYAQAGCLPQSLEELGRMTRPEGWPLAPTATTQGTPVTYRTTGPKAFALVLPGRDGRRGTADDLVIPEEVPDDLPVRAAPEVFRVWWQTRMQAQRLEALRKATEKMLPPAFQ